MSNLTAFKPVPLGHRVSLALLLGVVCMLTGAVGVAQALTPPLRELPESHFGWNVNRTKEQAGAPQPERNICTVASDDECQPGQFTSEIGGPAGGFANPVGLAAGTSPDDYLYLADKNNARVQVLTPQGAFLSMWGWHVDKTTGANVCTAASHDECQSGQEAAGGPVGQLAEPTSIAVDQSTHDIYVLDWANRRVVKYTPNGEFVLMIGGEVNETEDNTPGATEAQKNLCTAEEIIKGAKCKAGIEAPGGTKEHGAFHFENERGDLLAVGTNGTLYVGGEGGVQEFAPTGKYETEVPVSGTVEALAVDTAGDLYVIDENPATTIHKYNPTGTEVTTACSTGSTACWPLTLKAREAHPEFFTIQGLAVDAAGRLATNGFEIYRTLNDEEPLRSFGLLLNGENGEAMSEFNVPRNPSHGLAFAATESAGGFNLYIVEEGEQQVSVYRPLTIAGVSIQPPSCVPGPEHESDVTFTCSFSGETDPWGIAQTEAAFEWGTSPALGASTPLQALCGASCLSTLEGVSAVVQAPPNATIYDRLFAYDEHIPPSAREPAVSGSLSTTTPMVAPRFVGAPESQFTHASTAVLYAELNPENARTEYRFEYAPAGTLAGCPHGSASESCPGVSTTPTQESGAYEPTGATAEIIELQSAKAYEYRLFAENENTAKTEKRASISAPSTLVTAAAPAPRASTGGTSAVTATGALISGSVNPDGTPATYTFELGVYHGTETHYGVVSSGPIGEGTTPVEETLALTGLQPGTTYAYRIAIKSGHGEETPGASMIFTTQGLPAIIETPTPLPMLALPPIAFPGETAQTGAKTKPKSLSRRQLLSRALKACAKKPKGRRAACRRSAHKRYGVK